MTPFPVAVPKRKRESVLASLRRGLLLGLLTVSALGCGNGLSYNDKVRGTVKLDGKPVANVRVVFMPQLGAQNVAPQANAMTDAEGQFQMMSDNGRAGAVLGKHRVVVAQGRPTKAAGEKRGGTILPIPKVYGSLTDSPLVVEVRADQEVYDLDMKSEPN